MKARALWIALIVGVVSMTSGCHCFRCMFPNAGWRIQSGWWRHGGCGPCGPCAPCGPGPIAFRPPVVVPGGPDCPCDATPVMHSPAGYPPVGYPPIIGSPQPIPGGPNVIPSNQLPAPMSEKKKDGQ